MQTKFIKNANVVTENGIIFDGAVLISDNIIKGVGKERDIEIPEDAEIIDADGCYVGPGFVDIHVHGGNGYATYEEPEKAGRFFLEHGTTTLFATPFYHMNLEELVEGIRVSREAIKNVPNIKGIYVEGPYINVKYGASASKTPWRYSILEEEVKAMVDAGGEDVKVWTIAPEREGILTFTEYARKVNPSVKFAVGHSEATPEEIRKLGKYRPAISTHIMNATGRTGGGGGVRGYGPDEYCFAEGDMYAELISDSFGLHVNAELQRMILKIKGTDKVILITDGTTTNNPNPPHLSYIEDLNFDENGELMGSKLTMDMACRNIMSHTDCGICQAFKMASLNPAKAVGMGDEIGSIREGKIADIIFVDDKFNVKKVILNGEVVK